MRESSAFQLLVDTVARARFLPEARLLVAVSGGPDSVALLLALAEFSRLHAPDWRLGVGHINHMLRGAESDEDETFVCELSASLRLVCDARSVDTTRLARERHISIETAARQARSQLLREMLAGWGGDLIVTGHTLDDQAETVIMRLLRGTGSAGLASMRAIAPPFARPLLSVPKADILQALSERVQTFRLDRTNSDARYFRNRVRWEVMPVLESLKPGAAAMLARTANLALRQADYMTDEAGYVMKMATRVEHDSGIQISRAVMHSLHPGLRAEVVRAIIEHVLGDLQDIEEKHVSVLSTWLGCDEPQARPNSLPRNLYVTLLGDDVVVGRSVERPGERIEETQLIVPGRTPANLGDIQIGELQIDDAGELSRLMTVCGHHHAVIDARQIVGPLCVRSWQAGDRMFPMNAPGTRKLQDIFTDRHIPRNRRPSIPIVHDEEGIVWVAGIALDHRVRIQESTSQVLHLRYQPYSRHSVVEFGG